MQTEQAVGQLKQFSMRKDDVYKKRLNEIPLQYNVGLARNSDFEGMSRSLRAIGAFLDDNKLKHEENLYKIAQSVVTPIYAKLTDEQKRTMTAVEILAQHGRYDMEDNPYAMAILDGMRGNEIGKRIHSDYMEYRANMPLSNTLVDEMQSYDEFYKSNIENYLSNEHITNQFAFDMGLSEVKAQSIDTIAGAYKKNKEEALNMDAYNALGSMANEIARYPRNMTKEQWTEALSPMVEKYRLIKGSSAEENAKRLKLLADGVSQGGIVAMEAFGDLEIDDGTTFKDTYLHRGYQDQAGEYEKIKLNDDFLTWEKQFSTQSTREGVLSTYNDLEKTNPELARIFAPNVQRYIAHADAKQEALLRERQKELKEAQKKMLTFSMQDNLIKGMRAGVLVLGDGTKIPQSESELKNIGLDLDMFGAKVMEEIQRGAESGDTVGLDKLLSSGIGIQSLNKFLSNNLAGDLATLNPSSIKPSIQSAFLIMQLAPDYAKEILGKNYAPMNALNILKNNTENWAEVWSVAYRNMDSDTVKQDMAKYEAPEELELKGKNGDSVDVPVNAYHMNSGMEDIKELTKILVATGQYGLGTAKQLAQEQYAKNHIAIKKSAVPRSAVMQYAKARGITDEAQAINAFEGLVDERLDENATRYGVTVSYNPRNNSITIIPSNGGSPSYVNINEAMETARKNPNIEEDNKKYEREKGMWEKVSGAIMNWFR